MSSRKQDLLGRILDMNRLSPVGEEELTLAREGGHSERAALNRRFSSGYDKGEYEGLVALKTAAEKGDKNARDQWDTLCAWTKVIKKNAKDTRLPEIYRKSQQTLLNNLRAMNLFPGLADMYETLGNSSIGDRSSNALAQQIAMAPVVNAITSPSTYAADPFSDYTPIDFVVDIASMLNPFKSSDEDKARKRDYQRAFQYVKKVMASEPKPNPTDLDYALVYTTNRKPDGTVFLLDNDGHITPAFDQDKSEA